MADDVGEALHLGVAFLEVGGALGDPLLQTRVRRGERRPGAVHGEARPRLDAGLPPRQRQDGEQCQDGGGGKQQETPQPGAPSGLHRGFAVADREIDGQIADALIEAEPIGSRGVAARQGRMRRRDLQGRQRGRRDGRDLGQAHQHLAGRSIPRWAGVDPHQRHMGVVRQVHAAPIAQEVVEVGGGRSHAAEPSVGVAEPPRDQKGRLAADPADDGTAQDHALRPVARRREGRPVRHRLGRRHGKGQRGEAQASGGVGEQQVADGGQGVGGGLELVVQRARRFRVVPRPVAERQGGGAEREVGHLEQAGRVVGQGEGGPLRRGPRFAESDLSLVRGDEPRRADDEGEAAGAERQRDAIR